MGGAAARGGCAELRRRGGAVARGGGAGGGGGVGVEAGVGSAFKWAGRGCGLGKGLGDEESSPDSAVVACAGRSLVRVGQGEEWAGAAGQLGLGPVRSGGKT